MKISKEDLVRELFYRIFLVFVPTFLAILAIITCLKSFVYKTDVYIPAITEIFDISLVFTLLFLRVKISKLSWRPVLSEVILISITSGLIYALWHSVLGWRYENFCQYIKIENILFIKIIYIVFIYMYDYFKKIFQKKENKEDYEAAPRPLDL